MTLNELIVKLQKHQAQGRGRDPVVLVDGEWRVNTIVETTKVELLIDIGTFKPEYPRYEKWWPKDGKFITIT